MMRSFARLDEVLDRVPGGIVTHLRTIDHGAGSEALYRHQAPELLVALAERARGESITASSAIEGVIAAPQRARQIISGRPVTLRTRDEQQLAGYREAVDYLLRENWRPLNVGLLLHLHRLLWGHTQTPGGVLKTEDNLVVDRDADGDVVVRFRPVGADQTEFFLAELVDRYVAAVGAGRHHPVLLVGLFVLDLTVIHPFEDGNGRVARAVANALLADAGYAVGRWVSLEQVIAETADRYYEALLASTHGWHDDQADVWPWLTYFVDVLTISYQRFTGRVRTERTAGSKQERVREYVLGAGVIFRIADVRDAVPGVSDNTIRLVLNALKAEGEILSEGTGRSAVWRRTS